MLTTVILLLMVSPWPMPGSASAATAGSRAELRELAAQLRENPADQDLRERILKVAAAIKPRPSASEEAERHMARGAAALETAKSEADCREAAEEFEKAILASPWLAEAYYNLGVAQSKAGDPSRAAESLRLYLLGSPKAADAKEAKSLLYKMEYAAEKAARDAVSTRNEQAETLKKLAGIWKGCILEDRSIITEKHFERWEVNGEALDVYSVYAGPTNEAWTYSSDGRKQYLRKGHERYIGRFKLNGRRLEGVMAKLDLDADSLRNLEVGLLREVNEDLDTMQYLRGSFRHLGWCR